ncbi:hypothetical protein SAMN05421837_104788 [Amycolatopsis pretoriensis]|uniref:Uncharacterized protein n=2 Tax=Amycolatopsis pretoriensis TaxID=218821 RepID=A0A1H5QWD3_9PSEU|nr:hypothetical protein SAMN05421837_104788 [Amycolatopsis pretoriensis]
MTKPPEHRTPPPRPDATATHAEEAENDQRWWEDSRVLAWLEGSTLEGFEHEARTTPFLRSRCRTDVPPRPEKAGDDD